MQRQAHAQRSSDFQADGHTCRNGHTSSWTYYKIYESELAHTRRYMRQRSLSVLAVSVELCYYTSLHRRFTQQRRRVQATAPTPHLQSRHAWRRNEKVAASIAHQKRERCPPLHEPPSTAAVMKADENLFPLLLPCRVYCSSMLHLSAASGFEQHTASGSR